MLQRNVILSSHSEFNGCPHFRATGHVQHSALCFPRGRSFWTPRAIRTSGNTQDAVEVLFSTLSFATSFLVFLGQRIVPKPKHVSNKLAGVKYERLSYSLDLP